MNAGMIECRNEKCENAEMIKGTNYVAINLNTSCLDTRYLILDSGNLKPGTRNSEPEA